MALMVGTGVWQRLCAARLLLARGESRTVPDPQQSVRLHQIAIIRFYTTGRMTDLATGGGAWTGYPTGSTDAPPWDWPCNAHRGHIFPGGISGMLIFAPRRCEAGY